MLKTSTIIVSVIILTTLSLTGCASKFTPQVNPNPKYFMTVTGHIDPVLAKNLKVTWEGQYFSHNPKCRYVKNWEAGPINRMAYAKFKPIIPDKQGNYTIIIPINYYSEGTCKWKVEGFYYSYTYKTFTHKPDANTSISLSSNGEKIDNPMKQIWLCGQKLCNLTKNSTITIPNNLSSNNSMRVTVNFKLRKDY